MILFEKQKPSRSRTALALMLAATSLGCAGSASEARSGVLANRSVPAESTAKVKAPPATSQPAKTELTAPLTSTKTPVTDSVAKPTGTTIPYKPPVPEQSALLGSVLITPALPSGGVEALSGVSPSAKEVFEGAVYVQSANPDVDCAGAFYLQPDKMQGYVILRPAMYGRTDAMANYKVLEGPAMYSGNPPVFVHPDTDAAAAGLEQAYRLPKDSSQVVSEVGYILTHACTQLPNDPLDAVAKSDTNQP